MIKFEQVTIIGLGLIGGSIALHLKEKKLAQKIIGVEKNKNYCQQALKLHLIDEIKPVKNALKGSELIILATPVTHIKKNLPIILSLINSTQFVMDVGSTKLSILDSIKNHPNKAQFIPSHPMWGTEYSGPNSATLQSFKGKKTVICKEKYTSKIGLQKVQDLYHALEMDVIFMSAKHHDESVAYISHISHISSFALAKTTLIKEKKMSTILNLASSGFESTVRLAKSNPDTWSPIFIENKNFVQKVLKEYIHQLKIFEKSLRQNNEKKIKNFMIQANIIKKIL